MEVEGDIHPAEGIAAEAGRDQAEELEKAGAEGCQGEVAGGPQDTIDSLDFQFIFTFPNISFEYNILLWLVGSHNMSPVRD